MDLGCALGTMTTEKLAIMDMTCIGVDNSEDMLELAMEKRYGGQGRTFFIFFRIYVSSNYMEQ